MMTALSICLSAGASQAHALDYSRGYCVLLGMAIEEKNAIVVVDDHKFNGRDGVFSAGHMFFSPYSTANLRGMMDWAEPIFLEKTGEVNGHLIAAVLSQTHFGKEESQPVICIASGAL